MGFLTSVFTFKRDFQNVFTNEKVKEFFKIARDLIIKYRDFKELSGEEKKKRVDEFLTNWLFENVATKTDNAIICWLLGILIYNVPTITQFIYDFLKENIEGITKA